MSIWFHAPCSFHYKVNHQVEEGLSIEGTGVQAEPRNGVSGTSLKLGHYGLIGRYDSWSVLPGSTHSAHHLLLAIFTALSPPRRVTEDQMDERCSLTCVTKTKSSGREVVLRVAHKCLSPTAENSGKKSRDPGLGVKGSWTLLTKHIN